MCTTIHMYADDTQLHIHCETSDTTDAVAKLERCIAARRLKMNSDKSEVIWVDSRRIVYRRIPAFVSVRASVQQFLSYLPSTFPSPSPSPSPFPSPFPFLSFGSLALCVIHSWTRRHSCWDGCQHTYVCGWYSTVYPLQDVRHNRRRHQAGTTHCCRRQVDGR